MDAEKRYTPPKTVGSKKRKKHIAASATALIVIAAACAGFFVWHEQPSFCNAVCHSPMDPYVESFSQDIGTAGTDAAGMPVDDTAGMLSIVHKEKGMNCLSCHVPTLSEQISEASLWIAGGFAVEEPLEQRTTTDMALQHGKRGDSFCLNESCHNVSREQLALLPKVSSMSYNPHKGQHTEMSGTTIEPDCSDCHKSHEASVMYCTKCHIDAETPPGWVSWQEYEKKHENIGRN